MRLQVRDAPGVVEAEGAQVAAFLVHLRKVRPGQVFIGPVDPRWQGAVQSGHAYLPFSDKFDKAQRLFL